MFKAVSWRARISSVVGIAVVAGGLGPVAATAVAPACAGSAPTEAAAAALAVACQRDVVVDDMQSEYTRVVARSDGRRTLESTVVPQRARQTDGRWADIDLTLTADGKGGLKPRVSIADVSFSAGGASPLVTMRRSGKTMTMTWPGKLPAPVVSGDSATYRDVHKDVDLVVRATRTGFTHVLVVKNPAAAAAVRQVRFRMGGDARVQRQADGSLRAAAGDVLVGHSRPAVMWDSSAAPMTMSADHRAPSSARGAGDLARIRSVATEVSASGELVLRPDATLLSAAASAYPLYVDPDWEYGSGSGQKWAYANNTNSNNEYSVARVGKSPGTGEVYRSFFEFPASSNSISLKGKHIEAAYVQMNLTHSSSCTAQYTYMYATPAINARPRATWSAMTLSTFLASQKGNANEAGGCDPIQGDMKMNFQSSALVTHMQNAATNNLNSVTVGFAARDTSGGGETTETRWMKYVPEDAKLVVEYDSIPAAPSSLQVHGVACPIGVLTVGTLAPNLSAVHPDADGGQTLTAAYEWIEVPAGGMSTVTDTAPVRKTPPPNGSVTAGGREYTSALTGVAKGKTYAFRAKSTDPAPYSKTGPWSGWCQFKVDDTVPNVSVSVVSAPAGPGKPGTFTISSTSTDVTKFKWGWGAATTEVTASGTNPRTATITATAPKFGQNILFVSAVDATLNEGSGSKEFTVGRPSPAVARWGLETYPGMTQTAALADQEPALRGNTSLTAGNLNWANDARLIGGQTTKLNGSYLTTTPVVDTSKSFSVAAWVRLDDINSDQVIAAQVGSARARFILYYSHTQSAWRFYLYEQDGTSTNGSGKVGTLPVVGQWTHVAGVYDATEKTVGLYINGVHAGSAIHPYSWNAASAFYLGRTMTAGSSAASLRGNLADAQVFDRVLVAHDFTGMLASHPDSGGFNEPGILAPIKMGGWDFEAATPCYTTDLKDACESPDNTAWNRWLALSRGSSVAAGRSGLGLALDNAYFPEEGLTGSTTEYGRSAVKSGTAVDGDGNELTVWQDKPVLRTDQSFTISVWARMDRTDAYQGIVAQDHGTRSAYALYYAPENGGSWKFLLRGSPTSADDADTSWAVALAPNATETWQHLIVAVDVPGRKVSMYVDGVLKNSAPMDQLWQPWQATGPLVVGRSINATFNTRWLSGSVDDLMVYQGAMTDAAAANLHAAQDN